MEFWPPSRTPRWAVGVGGSTVDYNTSFTGGISSGVANLSDESLAGAVNFPNTNISGVTVSYTLNQSGERVTTVLLRYSTIQVTVEGSDYSIYLETKSPYAPNGDSGTFVYDPSSGTLLSGSQASLIQLAQEIEQADPQQTAHITVTNFEGFSAWAGSGGTQMQQCSKFAALSMFFVGSLMVGSAGGPAGLLAAGGYFDFTYGADVGTTAAGCGLAQ